jgi:hypothetical protein
MRSLKLAIRGTLIAALVAVGISGAAASPAWADEDAPAITQLTQLTQLTQPTQLSLTDEGKAGAPSLLEEASPASTDSTGSGSAASPASWWVWAAIGAAAVGVGALIFLSSAKDPSCPAGRVCQ